MPACPTVLKHPVKDIPDGGTSDGEAELGELAVDAAVAPARVLPRQAHDECFELRRDRRSATGTSAREGPFAADELAMPLQHRLRPEQQDELTQPAVWATGEVRGLRRQNRQGQLLPPREAR